MSIKHGQGEGFRIRERGCTGREASIGTSNGLLRGLRESGSPCLVLGID